VRLRCRSFWRLIESPDIHGVIAKEFSQLMRPENFKDYELLQAFTPGGPQQLCRCARLRNANWQVCASDTVWHSQLCT
jgi:hypothetical protein